MSKSNNEIKRKPRMRYHPYLRKCSKCGMAGHNCRTCHNEVHLQKAQTIKLQQWLDNKKQTHTPKCKYKKYKYKKYNRDLLIKSSNKQHNNRHNNNKHNNNRQYRVKECYKVHFMHTLNKQQCSLFTLLTTPVLPTYFNTRRKLFKNCLKHV